MSSGADRGDAPDVEESATESVEDAVREDLAEQRPDEAEREQLLEAHRHHLVRATTSQLTTQEDTDAPVTLETTAEVPDTFCFTCEAWIGLSGVDLRGRPRSKADAYYLDGPPEGVLDAEETVRDHLADLAAHVLETVEHVENVEDALEFVGDQHERLQTAAEEVDE